MPQALRRESALPVCVLGPLLGLSPLLPSCFPVAASAATILVDSTADENASSPPNGTCTLREAIIAANTNVAQDGCVAGDPPPTTDLIEIPAGTYLRTLGGSSENAAQMGDLDLTEDVVLQGQSSPVIDAQRDVITDADRLLEVLPGVTAELRGLELTGGASLNATAGIVNAGTLLLEDSSVYLNVATGSDAGGSSMLAVGGISNTGDLTLRRSTVRNNGVLPLVQLLFGTGGIRNSGTLTLANSTLSNNGVDLLDNPFGIGSATGGMANSSSGTATLTNTTVSENNAVGDPFCPMCVDGIRNNGTVTFVNTILEDACAGSFVDGGYNIDAGTSCGLSLPSSMSNTDPLITPLSGDHGGPTWTHALLPGSPAIDAGDDAACPPTDQRGLPRPERAACDIGAFELQTCEICGGVPFECMCDVGASCGLVCTAPAYCADAGGTCECVAP